MPDKAITVSELNTRDGGLCRFMEIREIDEESRTVDLAFSSEAAVERWFGDEVLVHDAKSVRMDRIRNGGPLLMDHNPRDQIGVVESATIDKDRVGRARVRFSRSARAEEIWQDVKDGIRTHVSVRYAVHKIERESRKSKVDLVRLVDWEPMEISIVSIPADTSVGVGRDLDGEADALKENKEMSEKAGNEQNQRNEPGTPPAAAQPAAQVDPNQSQRDREAGAAAERERRNDLEAAGEAYGLNDLAREFIADGRSLDDFKAEALERLKPGATKQRGARSGGGQALPDADGAEIGLSARELENYSVLKLIRFQANPGDPRAREAASLEIEASQAAYSQLGKVSEEGRMMVPFDVLNHTPQRAVNTGTGGVNPGDTGGYGVATDLLAGSFIEMLTNRSVLMSLTTALNGLVGNVDIPAQDAGSTGYWLGEDEDTTESAIDLRQVSLTPKTCAARVPITRKMLVQNSVGIESRVRADIVRTLGLTIDLAGFYGDGLNNQPLGIVNSNGINAVDFAVAEQPTYSEMVQMETEIASDNADVNSMAYVTSAAMRGYLKTKEKFAGSNGATIWEPGNTVNGYRTEITNQIQSGDVIFGNFNDVLVGLWGGLEIQTDPYTGSKSGRVEIQAFQDVDFALRHVESFCLGRFVA